MTQDDAREESDENEFSERVINQIFELWMDAELERRGATFGREGVSKAVVELPPGGSPVVKINDEVELSARAVASSAIAAGTPVSAENIRSLEEIWPTSIGEDSGWIAYYVVGDAAYAAFDFRYNKGRAARLLAVARSYLRTAEAAVSVETGPAVDTLYSAAELTVQAQMLSQSQETKVHKTRGLWLEQNEDLGNTPNGFSDLLQRLRHERAAARYGDGFVTLTVDELRAFVHEVDDMIDFAEARIGHRPPP